MGKASTTLAGQSHYVQSCPWASLMCSLHQPISCIVSIHSSTRTANFGHLLAFLLPKFTVYQVLFCWDWFPRLKGSVTLLKSENSEFCPLLHCCLGVKKAHGLFLCSLSPLYYLTLFHSDSITVCMIRFISPSMVHLNFMYRELLLLLNETPDLTRVEHYPPELSLGNLPQRDSVNMRLAQI